MKIIKRLLLIAFIFGEIQSGFAFTTGDYISAMSSGNYDKAISVMNDLIKETPNNADYYYKRASAYEKKGNYLYAAVDCSTAIEYAPANKDYYLLRGKCKQKLNDPTYVNDFRNAGSEGLALLNETPESKPRQNIIQPPKSKSPSDVDINIPVTSKSNENTFVLIFCNENYMEDGISNVEYAKNDGNTFREYCIKTLGIPEQNIHIREDATKNQMRSEIKWAKSVADVFGNDGQLIVYYSGHGMPDEKTKRAYILPADGIANDPESAYSLAQLYDELGEMDFKATIVLLDACFSGTKRNGEMLTASKGVAIKPSIEELSGNVAVLSATDGDDTAYPDDENSHGLFTYYLLKNLKETKGEATIEQLADYVTTGVKRSSVIKNNKLQQPNINYSNESTVQLNKIKLTR